MPTVLDSLELGITVRYSLRLDYNFKLTFFFLRTALEMFHFDKVDYQYHGSVCCHQYRFVLVSFIY